MENRVFQSQNVPSLKKFLSDRGVVISKTRRNDLVLMCEEADRLGLEIDPDGLLENRSETVQAKLKICRPTAGTDFDLLPLPTLINATADLTSLPTVKSFDILHYLSKGQPLSAVRDHKKMEGYQLYRDGFVLELNAGKLGEQHSSLLAKVKPRTNAKDPLSGLPYYICWVVLAHPDTDERIHSAYCCCRGGIDGFCRHVAAALFELMRFAGGDGGSKPSCTSMPCVWNRPSNLTVGNDPVELHDLNTSLTERGKTQEGYRYEEKALDTDKPDPQDLLSTIKDVLPSACMLDIVYERATYDMVTVACDSPSEKLEKFRKTHLCVRDCKCSYAFVSLLKYSATEINDIQKATVDQDKSPIWHQLRKYLLTASRFKTICHSRDADNTALQLLKLSGNDLTLIPAINYGKTNEKRALNLFFRSHQISHKKCHLEKKGLCISEDMPFLACSPDGVLHCSSCGPILLEIKCIWKHRNFHPRTAGVMAKIIHQSSNEVYVIDEQHAYNYQIQGQMGVTGTRQAFLVIYTDKGIHSIKVPFHEHLWVGMRSKLESFYHDHFFPHIFKMK